MGQIVGAVLLLVVLQACLPGARRAVAPCLVATSARDSLTRSAGIGAQPAQEPRWIRLAGRGSDTTGVATLGLSGGTVLEGRWWRRSADSLRVDAAGPFDAVWLRLRMQGDSAAGEVELRTDADLLRASVPIEPWRGQLARCPKQ